MNKRVHIVVEGFVQGVFFRMHTQNKARELGLTGWAKNRIDGNVEIMAEGPEGTLKSFETWCYEGSPHSRVTDVLANYMDATGEFRSFDIRY